MNNIEIFNENFISTNKIENNSIDLIVTSPPYNVKIEYGEYDDAISYSEYLKFSENYLKKIYDVMKPDGRFCLNIPMELHKGYHRDLYFDIFNITKKIGFTCQTNVFWNKTQLSKRSAWGSWLSASSPYISTGAELIIMFYKGQWKKKEKGESDITKKEFTDYTFGTWSFNGETSKKIGHPAPFPVELPYRCIKLLTYKNDLVLDPFNGSGTTMIACLKTGRRGIGFDIDKNYCDIADKRVEDFLKQMKLNF